MRQQIPPCGGIRGRHLRLLSESHIAGWEDQPPQSKTRMDREDPFQGCLGPLICLIFAALCCCFPCRGETKDDAVTVWHFSVRSQDSCSLCCALQGVKNNPRLYNWLINKNIKKKEAVINTHMDGTQTWGFVSESMFLVSIARINVAQENSLLFFFLYMRDSDTSCCRCACNSTFI